jgi:cyclase
MLAKRLIPCLDVHDGHVTRGEQFGKAEEGGLRNVGDPVALALAYDAQGADELVFYDITASAEKRATMVDVIGRVADQCFMPLTVGGGLRSVDDMQAMLRAGADKVSLNSAALRTPDLIRAGAEKFGRQCIVVSMDVKRAGLGRWEVFARGGREATGREALAWAREAVARGAGELVVNSIDADGMKTGYDLELTRRVSDAVPVPVVASGGAGALEHLADVLTAGRADAALAASIFHYGTFTVPQARRFLAARGVPVREAAGG